MKTQTELAEGIKAAKQGDKAKAQEILYSILDKEPKNESAWTWLSYVVDTAEDRQICLENVLFLNPKNDYARRGLNQLEELSKAKQNGISTTHRVLPAANIVFHKLSIPLITAFWSGVSILFLVFGTIDMIGWGVTVTRSRTFPRYITTTELLTLAIAITLFIFGVVSANLAWTLFQRYRIGYYVSIILAILLTLIGPTVILIQKSPNYLLAMFMAAMPAFVTILTLMSEPGFGNDRQAATLARRD